MTISTKRIIYGATTLAAGALLCTATIASAFISGDGKGKPETDCYIGINVDPIEDLTPYGKKGKPAIQCKDGDSCDLDGVVNNSCLLRVQACINQPVEGCTATPLKKAKATGKVKFVKGSSSKVVIEVPQALEGSACGGFLDVTMPVKVKGNGTKKDGSAKLKLQAVGAEKGTGKDKDKFTLVCLASDEPTNEGCECPNNEAGGPCQITMTVNTNGPDLDNGISGLSHNFPVPNGTQLKYCLSECDQSTNPICKGAGTTGPGSLNGSFFGPPLPLFSSNVPVCVINEYKDPMIQATINVQDGTFDASMNGTPTPVVLNSKVYQGSPTQVCPRCSGGTCDSGARQGQSCKTQGSVTVNNPPNIINAKYNLSSDCPPANAALLGAIEVILPLTTDTSLLDANADANGFPCPGQTQDDNCFGASCSINCGPDGQNVVDPKGGVQQLCCNNPQRTPCFPTSDASGAQPIERTGEASVPMPAWPEATYPKTNSGKLVAVFCEDRTTNLTVDATAGLPGPGALILPGDNVWLPNNP